MSWPVLHAVDDRPLAKEVRELRIRVQRLENLIVDMLEKLIEMETEQAKDRRADGER